MICGIIACACACIFYSAANFNFTSLLCDSTISYMIDASRPAHPVPHLLSIIGGSILHLVHLDLSTIQNREVSTNIEILRTYYIVCSSKTMATCPL